VKLDEVVAHIAEQQGKLEACRAESQNLGKQIAQLSEYLGAAKEHRSGLVSRQNLLKDLEAKREGVSEGVKSVLRDREQKFPFVRGLVADVLRVDVEHAHVIEAALDGRDQWLVSNDEAAMVAARESFDDLEGRVNFINGAGYEPVSHPSRSPTTGTSTRRRSGWRSTSSGSSRRTARSPSTCSARR
jgi:chromosome segregation protein